MSLTLLQPSAVNPFEMAELGEPNVMGLRRICQNASFNLIVDYRVVFGRVDPMIRLVLPDLEVDDFEQDRDAGIESDVHEHAKPMD
jgi:hypothetical protein